jgi:hypothetical protein
LPVREVLRLRFGEGATKELLAWYDATAGQTA